MLPTHIPRRPRMGGPTAGWSEVKVSDSAIHTARLCMSRPSSRWLILVLVFASSLWLVGPYLLGLPPPHHPHGHDHLFDGPPPEGEGHGRRPPGGWFGRPSTKQPPEPHKGPETVWSTRAEQVKEAYRHAWKGYMKLASPADELLPVTGGGVNNFNGWGVSIIDGLDTMWIMGLHTEFQDSLPIIANQTFSLTPNNYAPFFETVIRYLGGLLSAYALSNEPMLLAQADALGDMLLPALNTSSGLPTYAVNTVDGRTRQGWNGDSVLWAEALSCQMEYKYLAHLTGRSHYFDKVEHIMEIMYKTPVAKGLFPTKWDLHTGTPKNVDVSVGAFADSAYEYLLKQWLMTSKSEPKSRDLYLKSASGIIQNLLYLSPHRNLLYVTDLQFGNPTHVFEHLSCFLPGLLALGAHTLDLAPEEKEEHLWAAEGLAYTCYTTYADMETGLGPDEMLMEAWPPGQDTGRWVDHLALWKEAGREGKPPGLGEVENKKAGSRDYSFRKTSYLLRPETVESFYVLWKVTGDVAWRERGWDVFSAIERETRTKDGYASLQSVDTRGGSMKDEMPSYFLAETLKYLYLLFSEEDLIPLERWVFNTEGHPLPVYEWSEGEKEKYGIL